MEKKMKGMKTFETYDDAALGEALGEAFAGEPEAVRTAARVALGASETINDAIKEAGTGAAMVFAAFGSKVISHISPIQETEGMAMAHNLADFMLMRRDVYATVATAMHMYVDSLNKINDFPPDSGKY